MQGIKALLLLPVLVGFPDTAVAFRDTIQQELGNGKVRVSADAPNPLGTEWGTRRRRKLIQTQENICCCTVSLLNSDGCPPKNLFVPRTNQCCMLKPADECIQRGYVGRMWARLSSDYIVTQKPAKCELHKDDLSQGLGIDKLESPEALAPDFEVLLGDEPMWETLTTKNWNRVRSVRIAIAKLSKLHEDEFAVFVLKVWHQGQIIRTLEETTKKEIEMHHMAPIHFNDEDWRKEYSFELEYSRQAEGHRPRVARISRMVYVPPDSVCGVGFLQDSHRKCERGWQPVADILKFNVPDYALGVEYELVGAPEQSLMTQPPVEYQPHEEWYLKSANSSSQRTYTSLVETGVARSNARPCVGDCALLKTCIWDRLGWDHQYDKWRIEVDPSVKVMEDWQTNNTQQQMGIPFELVSPVLFGQPGLDRAVQVLAEIRNMGAQAPLTAGLHLHVNVRNKEHNSNILSLRQILSVYVSWARFQHIIDEIITPDRVGNRYAKGLYLSWGLGPQHKNAMLAILKRGHTHIWHMPPETDDKMTTVEACKAFIGDKGKAFRDLMGDNGKHFSPPWCEMDTTMPVKFRMMTNPEKYFQVNLTPLGRFGTLEFRVGSATLDPERAARWFQFIMAFIDAFKDTKLSERFFDDDFETDYKELMLAQQAATVEELALILHDKVEPDFFDYFNIVRPYEWAKDVGCVKLTKQIMAEPKPPRRDRNTEVTTTSIPDTQPMVGSDDATTESTITLVEDRQPPTLDH